MKIKNEFSWPISTKKFRYEFMKSNISHGSSIFSGLNVVTTLKVKGATYFGQVLLWPVLIPTLANFFFGQTTFFTKHSLCPPFDLQQAGVKV